MYALTEYCKILYNFISLFRMNIVTTTPFLLYPTNKAFNGEYSHHASNPILNFEWNEQFARAIDRKSLRLYSKLKIYNNNSNK